MAEKGKKGIYIIINTDEIGEDIEFYIRRIENDIASRQIFTLRKIILYSKNTNCIDNETEKICGLLADDYGNIVCLKDNLIEEILL